MKPTTIKRMLITGIIYNIILNGFLYIGQISIARSLSRYDYALFIVATNFVALCALIADLGLNSLFVRLFAEANSLPLANKKLFLGRYWGSILFVRILMSFVAAAIVSLFAPSFGYGNQSIVLMYILLVTLFISSRLYVVRSVGEAYLRSLGKYNKYIIYATIDAACFAIGLLFIRAYSHNVILITLIYTFCNIPGFILLTIATIKDLRSNHISLRIDFNLIKNIFREGTPLMFACLFMTLGNTSDPLILNKLSTPFEVSAFGASLRVQSALLFLPIVFASIIAPEITKLVRSSDILAARQLVNKGLRSLIVLSGGMALVITCISSGLVQVLFGDDKYSDIVSLITILSWSFVGISYSLFIIEIATAEGKQWIPMVFMLVNVVCSVTLDLLLIPKYGAYGACYARLTATIIASFAVWQLTKSMICTDRKSQGKFLIRFFYTAVIGALVYYLGNLIGFSIVLNGIVTITAYGLASLFLKSIEVQDLTFLINQISHRFIR